MHHARCSCSTASSRSPGLDELTVVKFGAPLTLGVLGSTPLRRPPRSATRRRPRSPPRIAGHDRPRPGPARRPARAPAARATRRSSGWPGELSAILDHIEKIDELDLDGVEPTSHVVELENVLRADEPRPSLPRDRALEQAPDAADGGFRVPSPGARERRAARPHRRAAGASAIEAGELSAPRGASRPTAAARPATTWAPSSGSPSEAPERDGRWRASRRRRQGPLLRRGRAEHGRLAHPRGLPAAVHGHRGRATCRAPARRCSARPTWTSSRWARRTRTPATARC